MSVDLIEPEVSWSIRRGDALDVLRTMPPDSVNCLVTSPPYWGLRDYGHAGQIGLEPSPDAFVAALVGVFREARRVLRDDGTCWLNLGDSYAASQSCNGGYSAKSTLAGFSNPNTKGRRANDSGARHHLEHGLKAKDLVGIPWRVAFALQADGWYLRSDIIWAKSNPMPESVTDRPTKAHEYVFLLSKSSRYWYDADAVAEPSVNTRKPGKQITDTRQTHGTGGGNSGLNSLMQAYHNGEAPTTRNARTVWTIPTEASVLDHYAVMPRSLARRCVRAGCPAGGVVLDPFSGMATTGVVAIEEGRHYVGIELNEDYARRSEERLRGIAPLLSRSGGVDLREVARAASEQAALTYGDEAES